MLKTKNMRFLLMKCVPEVHIVFVFRVKITEINQMDVFVYFGGKQVYFVKGIH